MKLSFIKKPNMNVAVIDNFYTPDELQSVIKETKEIYKFRQNPDRTGSATDEQSKFKKTGSGVFLYGLYYDWQESAILKYNRKIFDNQFLDPLIKCDLHYKHIQQSTLDDALVNYYSSNEEYKAHCDVSYYTILILLRHGEFKGGDIEFEELEEIVPFKENRAVIFPGCLTHRALPSYGTGTRVSIAHFISYRAKGYDTT